MVNGDWMNWVTLGVGLRVENPNCRHYILTLT